MDNLVNVFKALGDRNRLRIIKLLEKKKLCVCEIREIIGLSTSTVSNHLNILKNAGFVIDFKDGKWVNYALNRDSGNPRIQALFSLLSLLLNDDPGIMSDLERLKDANREVICGSGAKSSVELS